MGNVEPNWVAVRRIVALAFLALALPWAPARAAGISAAEVAAAQAALSGFNLVLSGNLTSASETEGRAVVGGNFSGSSNFCFNSCNSNTGTYGVLTDYGNVNGGASITAFHGDVHVGGNVASGATLSMQGGGSSSAYVGGNNAGSISLGSLYVTGTNTGTAQNGTVHTNQPLSTTFPYGSYASTFGTPFADLSATLKSLTPNQTISSNPGSNYVFNAMPTTMQNGAMVTVYQIGAILLSGMQNMSGFNANGANLVIVNVIGDTTASFQGINNIGSAAAVIWNFPDQTDPLSLGTWAGTVLAPNAAVTNTGVITGTLVAASLNQSAELHSQPLTGSLSYDLASLTNVPEPPNWAVLAGMLPILVLLRRRPRNSPA